MKKQSPRGCSTGFQVWDVAAYMREPVCIKCGSGEINNVIAGKLSDLKEHPERHTYECRKCRCEWYYRPHHGDIIVVSEGSDDA